MTRPTACTTSTVEFLALKKMTASRFGTSMPSARQRALVRILHSSSATASPSQAIFRARASEGMLPSTWSSSHLSGSSSGSSSVYLSTIWVNASAMVLEALMVEQKPTAL